MNTAEPLFHDDVLVGQAFSTGSYQLQPAEIQRFAAHHDLQPARHDHDARRNEKPGRHRGAKPGGKAGGAAPSRIARPGVNPA